MAVIPEKPAPITSTSLSIMPSVSSRTAGLVDSWTCAQLGAVSAVTATSSLRYDTVSSPVMMYIQVSKLVSTCFDNVSCRRKPS